jgi:uncharacterized protein (AIM24 family)
MKQTPESSTRGLPSEIIPAQHRAMSKKPVEFSAMLVDAMQHEVSDDTFSLESSKLLAVRFRNRVRVRPSRIVAGCGKIVYTPPGKLATPEGHDASGGGVFAGYEGDGRILAADDGKDITIMRMRNDESFGFAGHAVIAVDDKAAIDEIPVAIPAGGVWHAVMVTGPTYLAYSSHGPIRPIAVKPEAPVFVRPGFVIGWTIGMTVEAKGAKLADTRLSFTGTGQVFVQGAAAEDWLKV